MSLYRKKMMREVMAGLTTLAMVFQPQLLVAGEAVAATPTAVKTAAKSPTVKTPSDIVLQDKGVLIGRVVDSRGTAVAHSPVSLQTGGKEVARVVSDEMGQFEAKGLKGGVYQVASTGHQGVYRLWAPKTAPPAAAKGLNIVSQPVDVVRGQYGQGGGHFAAIGQWVAEHPIITAAGVATAIALPLALDDDDDPPATP